MTSDRVGYVGEVRVEPLAHRVLGDSQRGASCRGDREPDRAAVTVDRGALQEPVGDEGLDRGRDGGAGQRQLPGEPARPLLAAHDEGQEAVLGEREVGARPLERAGDPDQGEDLPVGAFLGRAHAESIANSSGSYNYYHDTALFSLVARYEPGIPRLASRSLPASTLRSRSGCRVRRTAHWVRRKALLSLRRNRVETPTLYLLFVVNAQPRTDVVLLRWPEEEARLESLRAVGAPRLLLVGESLAAPSSVDPLEDWIRLPAAEDDLRARVATLAARAGQAVSAPTVDGDGLLRHRGRWVTLSPVERALAAALVDRFGAVVGRDTLVRRAWPGGSPTRNALDVHMLRLRRRISSLGLEVRTVRARGYLLQEVEGHTGNGA